MLINSVEKNKNLLAGFLGILLAIKIKKLNSLSKIRKLFPNKNFISIYANTPFFIETEL